MNAALDTLASPGGPWLYLGCAFAFCIGLGCAELLLTVRDRRAGR